MYPEILSHVTRERFELAEMLSCQAVYDRLPAVERALLSSGIYPAVQWGASLAEPAAERLASITADRPDVAEVLERFNTSVTAYMRIHFGITEETVCAPDV